MLEMLQGDLIETVQTTFEPSLISETKREELVEKAKQNVI